MNPRIFVGLAVVILVAVLFVFAFTGNSVISDVGEDGFFASPSDQGQTVLPLDIDLHDLSILEVTEKQATLEVEFKVSNPNFKSVMLQLIKYSVYHDDELIVVGEIGTRPEGGVTSPNYFIILNERPSIIGEKFTIKNTGNTPELWQTLNNDELNWRVNAEIFFNLSSLTSGQENTLTLDFSKQD